MTKRKVGHPPRNLKPITLEVSAEIERLFLQNVSENEIAVRFGLARVSVQNHVNKHIRPEWQRRLEAMRDVEQAKVMMLERIAWERFYESMKMQKEKREEFDVGKADESSEKPAADKTPAEIADEAVKLGASRKLVKIAILRKKRTGEACWLDTIKWCIDWYMKVKGGYATEKRDVNLKVSGDMRVAGETREEFTAKALAELMEAIEERKEKPGK